MILTSKINWFEQTSLLQRYSSAVLIADEDVFKIEKSGLFSFFSSQLPTHTILLKAGEQVKDLSIAKHCWEEMYQKGLDRHSVVIALGGGTITDLAGFVAGCYMRGIDTILIPTTLMGMVDAAIGGKTGINFCEGKNVIGLFHPAKQIVCSMHYLETLPEREFCSGLAEVIKYGVIFDANLIVYLENNINKIIKRNHNCLYYIVSKSIEIKSVIVNEDPKDVTGRRALLNWGHTIGHAIESATDFKRYTHGEAIAIGMLSEAHISQKLNHANADFITRLESLINKANLPTQLPSSLSIKDLLPFMIKDKKNRSGKIKLALAHDFGKIVPSKEISINLFL